MKAKSMLFIGLFVFVFLLIGALVINFDYEVITNNVNSVIYD